jgi:hypothetical protein
MTTVSCREKPCPFPVERGQSLRGHHLRMFSYALEKDGEEDELSDTRYEASDRRGQVASAIAREELSVGTPGMGRVELEEKDEAKRFKKTITRLRGKRSYENAKVQGRCYNCGKPRSVRRVSVCEECRQKSIRDAKELRARRIKSGSCSRCGSKLPENHPFLTCPECSEAQKRKKLAKRHEKFGTSSDQRAYTKREAARMAGISFATLSVWLEDGLIAPPEYVGRTRQAWTDASVSRLKKLASARRRRRSRVGRVRRGSIFQRARRRRSDLRATKRCVVCGNANDNLPATTCTRCIAAQNRSKQKIRSARIAVGLCMTCGRVNKRLPKRECARCAKRSNENSLRYQRTRRNSRPDGVGLEEERCEQQQQ